MAEIEKTQGRAETGQPPAPGEGAGHPLLSLRREMDRLFDDFFAGFPFGSSSRRWLATDPWRRFQGLLEATYPAVEVAEDETSYRITAELPGMEEKDVELSLAGDVLTLKGEKRQEREEKEGSTVVSERRYGSFRRSFPLPEDADPERIEASFKNGVLTVTVPRKPEAQSSRRRIEIKPASS